MDLHRLAEERSVALHAAVAARLRADPALIERAIRRIEEWRTTGAIHASYASQWLELLARPLDEICAALVSRSEQATALRQCTPFAGVLDSATRWRIWRAASAEAST